jgi:hypothetical protein
MTDDLEKKLRELADGRPPIVEYSEAITALAQAVLKHRDIINRIQWDEGRGLSVSEADRMNKIDAALSVALGVGGK